MKEYIFEKFDGLENADHRVDQRGQDYMEVIVDDTPYSVYSHICPTYPDGGLVYVWWNAGKEWYDNVHEDAEAAFQAFIEHIDWSDLRVETVLDEGRFSTDAEAMWGLRIVRDKPENEQLEELSRTLWTYAVNNYFDILGEYETRHVLHSRRGLKNDLITLMEDCYNYVTNALPEVVGECEYLRDDEIRDAAMGLGASLIEARIRRETTDG